MYDNTPYQESLDIAELAVLTHIASSATKDAHKGVYHTYGCATDNDGGFIH